MVETTLVFHCPVSLAFLADTHNIDPEAILASLRDQHPALILHSGDFIAGRRENDRNTTGICKGSPNAIRLFEGCARLAPTFISIGNHEMRLTEFDLTAIRATGVTLLNNSCVTITKNGENHAQNSDNACPQIVIGGLTSSRYTSYRKHGYVI